MPLRLLYAVPALERPGGITRSIRRIQASLGRAGHEVLLCAPDLGLFPGDTRTYPGAFRFGPRSPEDLVADHEGALESAARLFKPDLVVGYYGSGPGVSAVRAAARLGRPAVVCLRGNDVDQDLGLPAARGLVEEATRAASAVTVVSRAMADKIFVELGVRTTFVPNAVDTEVFYPDPDAARALGARLAFGRRPVLGMFGEFKAKRGLGRLRALGPDLAGHSVLIVGRVRAEVRSLVPGDAHVVDWVDDDAWLRAAYSACDAIVQPSHEDGMPNVVLEAMACGRVVVASRAGGLPDLVTHGENGLLVSTDEELRDVLVSLRETPRPELGRAARAGVPRPEVERDAFLSVFQGAIRRYAAESASA